MRRKLHHIALIFLSVYVLSAFHLPTVELMHIMEHVIAATDFHHHHEHVHGADNETHVHEHDHEHQMLSFFESVFGEDNDDEDPDWTPLRELDKHLLIQLTELRALHPETITFKYGVKTYPLLTGHPLLLIPPPRTL